MRVAAEQERSWVLQAQKGDQRAFAKLVEVYQTPVYNLAYRMLGSAEEAEDAAQETFIRAYTRFDSYDPERKFSSWILSIASHHCVDRLRRRKGNTVSLEAIQSWRWIPDKLPRPEEETLQQEQERNIRRLLDQLPEQYRLVIILRYWYDMPYEEMAEMTETTVSAVKSRLHRARQMMAMKLNESETVGQDVKPSRRISENAMLGSF
ncbi:MAG: sigma-70 family RNA polymerase sigma factor [Chloroflexi bacterium]|nr:sigma-70 family RNA polymerase sigma factor [Chloroflexota bacterium]